MTTTILVIDNSEDDRRLYRQTFKDSDTSFSLIMVTSAEAGLGLIADTGPDVKRPDLILLDCNLPDLDGLGFIGRVSTCSPVPVPIIMLDRCDNVGARDGRMFPVEVTANVLEIAGVEYHCGFPGISRNAGMTLRRYA